MKSTVPIYSEYVFQQLIEFYSVGLFDDEDALR